MDNMKLYKLVFKDGDFVNFSCINMLEALKIYERAGGDLYEYGADYKKVQPPKKVKMPKGESG